MVTVSLGDPGADSGAEHENQNGREKIRRCSLLGRKLFCPIRSEYSFGRLELVPKEFVPRGSYLSFVLLLVEFFPACFDFRLRSLYLPLGLRVWVTVDLLQKKSCTYSSLSSWLLSKIPRGRLLSWFSLNFL